MDQKVKSFAPVDTGGHAGTIVLTGVEVTLPSQAGPVDILRGLDRVRRLRDGSADHQARRAGAHGIGGRHHPLLVADLASSGPNARHHEHKLGAAGCADRACHPRQSQLQCSLSKLTFVIYGDYEPPMHSMHVVHYIC